MLSGRSEARVCSASPRRISTRSHHAAGHQVLLGPLGLGHLELGGDQATAAPIPPIVAQGGGQVQGRDAERGPELDDRLRAAAAGQHVEQRARLARYRQREVLQGAIEVEIFGLAAHQPLALGGGHIGEDRAGRVGESNRRSSSGAMLVRVFMEVSKSASLRRPQKCD
jgi:hypothetical protein